MANSWTIPNAGCANVLFDWFENDLTNYLNIANPPTQEGLEFLVDNIEVPPGFGHCNVHIPTIQLYITDHLLGLFDFSGAATGGGSELALTLSPQLSEVVGTSAYAFVFFLVCFLITQCLR